MLALTVWQLAAKHAHDVDRSEWQRAYWRDIANRARHVVYMYGIRARW